MSPQDSPTPPAPAEVCERLKKLSIYLVLRREPGDIVISDALALIEQGEKERERVARLETIACAALNMRSALAPFDWDFIFSAKMNGGAANASRVKEALTFLENAFAAREQPTAESK